MSTYSKLLYRISEVSALLNLPISTIKYWTDTFEQIRPVAIGTGRQVKYRPDDIEVIKHVQYLMHDKIMTIEGAKKALSNRVKVDVPRKCRSDKEALKILSNIRDSLTDHIASESLNVVCRWIESLDNSNS